MTMTTTAKCTCSEDVDDCACLACAEHAKIADGCGRRLELIVAGQARNDQLYDGMCNDCFRIARDIRDCGLRIAEHWLTRKASATEATTGPCPSCGRLADGCSWSQNPALGRGDCCPDCKH